MAALPLFADPPQPVVVNAVTDRYWPLPFDQEKLAGLIAKRMLANSEGYLEHVEDQLSANSIAPSNSGPSAQTGKLLEASANAFAYRHDGHLRAAMDRRAKELITAERSDRNSAAARSEDASNVQDLRREKCDLLGLLAYYHVSQNDDALDAAKKIGDRLLKSFPKNSTGPAQYRRATTLIEPLVNLYRYTEDAHYLELSRSAAEAWFQSKETQSDPSAENLADLHGLVELYRVTGDESYFRPVPAAWIQVRNKWLSVTGNPLSNGDESASNVSMAGRDSCATPAWIQLTLNLLRITGEAQYAEQLERTIYNQLFAAQDASTGTILAPAPLNGHKQPVSTSDACVADEAQALALIPAAIWGRYGNGISVVLYTAGRATFQLRRRGTVQLYSEAAFPETGEFLLHVEPAHNLRFPLRLRVPAWTNQFVVDIGGSHLLGKPGDFLTLNREWKPGDTVKISIDMTPQFIAGTGEYADEIAVERGPQVLALAHAFNPQLKDLAEAALVGSDASRPKLMPAANKLPANWSGDQVYTVAGEYQGKPHELQLVPFADAKTYRVWLKKPSASNGGTK